MMTTLEQTSSNLSPLERIYAEHRYFIESLNGHNQGKLSHLRLRGIEELQRLGIPTVRHEEWKYTNLYSLLAKQFAHARWVDESVASHIVSQFSQWGTVVPVVNGRLVAFTAPGIFSLKEVASSDNQLVQRLGTIAVSEGNAIVAWNTAFLEDGVVVRIDQHSPKDPIIITSVLDTRQGNVMAHERHLVEVAPGGSATVVFVQRTVGDGEALLNQVLECWVGENAQMLILIVQDGTANSHAITTHEIELASNARLQMVTVSIGGGFIRNMPAARLVGEGAHAELYGLTIADGTMLVDHHTVVDHRVPSCTSNELYKAILDGRSMGVFNGKIFVRPNAQRTNAYQANRSIVRSPRATINAKPQLEIFANDVRCTHGCTVGRLDKEAMFYLRSRGLSPAEAEALLLTAFAEEITAQIPIESIRAHVNATIEHLFHADELA
ncbi:MAG: Fe-S cluster assembly protein SufD [Bacteroidota bacterium]|nr:Fe-S cluster assembly protein SufD [Bacteroidota bacterium]